MDPLPVGQPPGETTMINDLSARALRRALRGVTAEPQVLQVLIRVSPDGMQRLLRGADWDADGGLR